MPMRESLTRRLTTVVLDSRPNDSSAKETGNDQRELPSFPLELVDLFLEYLHPDDQKVNAQPGSWRQLERREEPEAVQRKRDLHACSLVCRGWNGITRAHLFRDVMFVVRAPHKKRGKEAYKTFVDYDDFLKASPAVAASVRRLRLDFPNQYRYDVGTQKLDPRILSLFLSRLPVLAELHLRNVYLTRPPVPRNTDPAESYTRLSLTRVQIDHTEANHVSDYHNVAVSDIEIIMLLGLFDSAETLHLSGLGIREDPTLLLDDYAGPERLTVKRLVLERAHNGPALFFALRNAGSLNSIRSFEIRMVAELEENYDMMKKPDFLALIKPTLEHLVIRLQRSNMPYGTNVIDLSSFASLRTLALSFTIQTHSSQHVLSHVLRSFPLLQLSRERHPRLEEFRLCVVFDAPAFWSIGSTRRPSSDLSWTTTRREQLDEIDQRLVGVVERCGLQGIIVEYEARGNIDAVVMIVDMFPISKQMGLLDVRDYHQQT